MPDEIPSWPSQVLPELSTSYAQNMEAMSMRTQMDSGFVRQRRRFTTELQTYAVEWEMFDSQYQIFISWFDEVLNHGNEWFNINLATGGGLSIQKARFVGAKYASQYASFAFWKVSASLEVMAPVRMPPGMVLLLLDLEFVDQLEDLELATSAYYELIHTNFPANIT